MERKLRLKSYQTLPSFEVLGLVDIPSQLVPIYLQNRATHPKALAFAAQSFEEFLSPDVSFSFGQW